MAPPSTDLTKPVLTPSRFNRKFPDTYDLGGTAAELPARTSVATPATARHDTSDAIVLTFPPLGLRVRLGEAQSSRDVGRRHPRLSNDRSCGCGSADHVSAGAHRQASQARLCQDGPVKTWLAAAALAF